MGERERERERLHEREIVEKLMELDRKVTRNKFGLYL